jgi:hypothetical protein
LKAPHEVSRLSGVHQTAAVVAAAVTFLLKVQVSFALRGGEPEFLMSELLQIKFQRCECQSTGDCGCFVPQFLISRCSQKIVALPSERKERSLSVFTRDGAPIGWENHCRSIGTLPDYEASLMHQHQVISNKIGVCGWIFRDTIALEKKQQVTDYVHVSLHGLTIKSVLIRDGLISGFTVEIG